MSFNPGDLVEYTPDGDIAKIIATSGGNYVMTLGSTTCYFCQFDGYKMWITATKLRLLFSV